MNRIKKKLIPVIALVLAMSMAFPAAAAPAIQYARMGTISLEEKADALQARPAAQGSGTGVKNASEALEAAYHLASMMGYPDTIELMFFTQLQTATGLRIYVFQQTFEGATVPGSTLRLMTDEEGRVINVFHSLFRELPESTGIILTDAEGAQASTQAYLTENYPEAAILPEYTEQVWIPQEDDAEHPSNEVLPDLLYWVVYSDNPKGEAAYPYMAHYVAADGTWLYSNEVKSPRDEASRSGFTAAYAFDGMEAAKWSGTVTDLHGELRQLTVPVMLDPETGTYYLGDVERRIALGEYYDFAYEDEVLNLVSSQENDGWEDDDLLTYANYIRVWDYYADMGWTGPDGNLTPSLLLRGLCTEEQEPMDNAAYMGHYRGWQIFGYDNSTYHFGEALDVMAHEFTHCVTETAQGENLYRNDSGAINESLSDIMGNLCQMELAGTPDPEWLVGEDTIMPIRSMLNPHDYNQPEYIWDEYYTPTTQHPNDMNDRGGVHSNSSILNRLAALLYLEDGMPLETLKDFWMMVIFGMTPMTDLNGMADVLLWALQETGNSEYETVLQKEIETVQLTRKEMPEDAGAGRTRVCLQLPDTETFSDEYWILEGVQWNGGSILDILEILTLLLAEGSGTEEETKGEWTTTITSLFSIHNTWVSDDTNTMNMILKDTRTLYLLINMDPETFDMKGIAVLAGHEWIDLMNVLGDMELESTSAEEMEEDVIVHILESGIEFVMDFLSSLLQRKSDSKAAGSVTILPTKGLESVTLR